MNDEDRKKADEDQQDCDKCIFCLAKCPECGSTDISAELLYGGKIFHFDNDIYDMIEIEVDAEPDILWFYQDEEEDDDEFLGRCHQCGQDFHSKLGAEMARIIDGFEGNLPTYIRCECGEPGVDENGKHKVDIEVSGLTITDVTEKIINGELEI